MLGADDIVGGDVLGGEAFLEPEKDGANVGIQVAEALKQLNGEGRFETAVAKTAENFFRSGGGRGDAGSGGAGRFDGGVLFDAEEAVGEGVGFLAGCAAADNAFSETAQIFDQDDAQRNGDGPKLADGERLYALVGVDEAAENFGIELAVGVGDVVPRDCENARVALHIARIELGQLAVKARRKIFANVAET